MLTRDFWKLSWQRYVSDDKHILSPIHVDADARDAKPHWCVCLRLWSVFEWLRSISRGNTNSLFRPHFHSPFVQYIPRNMHTVFALLCFVVVIHWLIFPYPSSLLHWHCGNLTIAPVPAKQPWWIWINTSCEFIMNDCITTTKQSTTKPCAYFLGYTVIRGWINGSKTRDAVLPSSRKIVATLFSWCPDDIERYLCIVKWCFPYVFTIFKKKIIPIQV